MIADELQRYAVELWGERSTATHLAGAMTVDTSTARKWLNGIVPVPGPVAAAIMALRQIRELEATIREMAE